LKAEQAEYAKEGIAWTNVEYFNNAIICSLIEDSKKGIITILDEELLRPGEKSDNTFLHKMSSAIDSEYFTTQEQNKKDKILKANQFRITHYAGNVYYDVDGFLEKNSDMLTKDMKAALSSSSIEALKFMFVDGESDAILKAGKRPASTATNFKASLKDLITLLNSRSPHYLRCVKVIVYSMPTHCAANFLLAKFYEEEWDF